MLVAHQQEQFLLPQDYQTNKLHRAKSIVLDCQKFDWHHLRPQL